MAGNVTQEVKGDNGRGEELSANDAGIGKGYLAGSGELEGDTPTIAELAIRSQQQGDGGK